MKSKFELNIPTFVPLQIGFFTFILIALKANNIINWDWVWVLSPLWIPAAIVNLVCLILGFLILCGLGEK